MDALCQELSIPKKQIKETKRSDRFLVIVHKTWQKNLVQQNCVNTFQVHPGFDEWPNKDEIGQDWSLTYFTVEIYFLFFCIHFH